MSAEEHAATMPGAEGAAVHTLEITGITHGAEGVGRLPDGKVCFVPYAIPGERVRVRVVEERRRWSRADLVEVVQASPDRVAPPCPYHGPATDALPVPCGGCRLQQVRPQRQRQLKRQIVAEQLERIGGFTDPPVAPTLDAGEFGYRAHTRFGVAADGRLGYRPVRGHGVVPIDTCLLLTPEAQAARDAAGDAWRGVGDVTVRTGADGAALEVHPGPGGMPPLPDEPAAVALVGEDGTAVPLRGEPATAQQVGGFRYRVSPTSFFQASPAGAAALLELVREAAAARPGDTVLDLYAGVGLFSLPLARDGATVLAVERSAAAIADAQVNCADVPVTVRAGDAVEVVAQLADEHHWFDVVVLDPPRQGAGVELCGQLAALEPRTVVYVACDPAALARDARALVDAGFQLELATPVDQFAQTAAIETVAQFTRGQRGA